MQRRHKSTRRRNKSTRRSKARGGEALRFAGYNTPFGGSRRSKARGGQMIDTLAHGGEWASPDQLLFGGSKARGGQRIALTRDGDVLPVLFGGSCRSMIRGGQRAALQAWQVW